MRERLAERQRAIEDPANNPFKTEPSETLKPFKPPPLSPPSALRATVELKVVGVADGDTLIISNAADQQLFTRLQGIDAPEDGQASKLEAQENLANLVSGKFVTVEFDPKGKPDTEGRIIAKVFLDGQDIALMQIRAGFAWYAKYYKKLMSESDRYTYPQAETDARAHGVGLWREKHPKAPWEYRKQ
jgi:endonuclease YncB( thermonuclease family)